MESLKKGDAFKAMVSPAQDLFNASELAERNSEITEYSVSFDEKN